MVWVVLWSVLQQVLEQTKHELIDTQQSISITAVYRKPDDDIERIHLDQELISGNPLHRFNHQITQSLLFLVLTHVLLLEGREDGDGAWTEESARK